jgi:hypothetical protein
VDVRADGGIAALPPSLGHSRIADDDGPFPPIPPMWLAAIQGEGKPPPPRPRRPPAPRDGVDAIGAIVDDIIARHGAIVDGARNDTLYKLGVRLRHADASDSRILDEVERIYGALVMPPLSEREVQAIARSAARGTDDERATTGHELCPSSAALSVSRRRSRAPRNREELASALTKMGHYRVMLEAFHMMLLPPSVAHEVLERRHARPRQRLHQRGARRGIEALAKITRRRGRRHDRRVAARSQARRATGILRP